MNTNNIIVNFIVAVDKNNGIGLNNKIPWNLKEDLNYFRKKTTENSKDNKYNIVIMGYNTYKSIPTTPLKNRINIVLTNKTLSNAENLYFTNFDNLYKLINNKLNNNYNKIYIIGGEQIYNLFLNNFNKIYIVDRIYLTRIYKIYNCDTFFNIIPDNYKLEYYSEKKESNDIKFKFLIYKKTTDLHGEYNYISMVKDIIAFGNKNIDRTGEGTKSYFGLSKRYNIEDSFPLLTTKKMYWKGIVEELLWMLKGDTNIEHLREKNVHIWDGNSTREYLDSIGLKDRKEYDGGPIYGFNMRHYGAKYIDCNTNYKGQGYDQIKELIRLIKEEPNSRRMLLNLWNPGDLDKVCLPACHCLYQFYVKDGYLSCSMYQRSADLGLGVPFNIASASLLTYILAKLTNLKPKELIHTIGDAHVYLNHIDVLNILTNRTPIPFPKLIIKENKQKEVEDFKYDDFELIDYNYHPTLKMKMAV